MPAAKLFGEPSSPVSNVTHCKYEDLFWNNKNYSKKNSLSFDLERQGVLHGMSVYLKKNELMLEVGCTFTI